MPKIKKETKIKREEEKLTKIFAVLDDDTFASCHNLIKNAAWTAASLDDIRDKIDEDGVYTESYTNGANQGGAKQSSLLQSYNNLLKSYNSIMKILLAQIPKDAPQGKDALAGFLLKN